MRVVILRWRVSIGHFCYGECWYLKGCSEDIMYLFFFRYICSCTLGLMTIFDIHCTYFLYIWGCMFLSPILTCVVSFLSLYTCFLHIVCNLIFLFHIKMPWWVLFKVFQKYKFSKSSCHKLSSYKVFQEFMLGYILLYSTSEYELSDLWLFSYVYLFVMVLSRISKGGDC